jgi:hypothetical protein
MQGLAAFVMRGPFNAGGVAVAMLLLGLGLPPFAWLSAAVIALVTLRLGAGAAARVTVPALIGLALAGWLLLASAGVLAGSALASWLPVVILALVLRERLRLEETLLVACALGWAVVFGVHLFVAEPTPFWREVLVQGLRPEATAEQFNTTPAAMRELIDRVAPIMTGMAALSLVLSALTSLLLARWWQAALYNPGGFGEEFRGLRLGRTVATVTLALSVVALATDVALLDGLALVAFGVYAFQGLAVVHALVRAHASGLIGLIALYIALVPLMPYVALGLVLLGAADAWADYRRRLKVDGTK